MWKGTELNKPFQNITSRNTWLNAFGSANIFLELLLWTRTEAQKVRSLEHKNKVHTITEHSSTLTTSDPQDEYLKRQKCTLKRSLSIRKYLRTTIYRTPPIPALLCKYYHPPQQKRITNKTTKEDEDGTK